MTRNSPSVHAKDFKNKTKKGNDGKEYISKPDKNGIYKWKLISHKSTPEKYFSQFGTIKKKYDASETEKKLKKITNEFKKHKIFLVKYSWKSVGQFAGDALTMISEKIASKYHIDFWSRELTDNYSFITYTDHLRYLAEKDGKLCLFHNITTKDKDYIIETFKKYFGKKFVWNGSNKKSICIYL
jgi:hypothetical protein